MGNVFVDVGMSLDGFIAGPNGGPRNPLGDGGMRIHEWVHPLAAFRSRLGMDGGDQGRDNELVESVFARTGAYVMGRRMFDEGEVGWPEDPPFRAPVFVVTHRSRQPWIRKGGTTFTFVATVDEALERARAAAAGRDVRISGGADVIQQCLEAAVVDELTIHLAPLLLGDGVPLFRGVKPDRAALSFRDVAASPLATHLAYRVSYPGR